MLAGAGLSPDVLAAARTRPSQDTTADVTTLSIAQLAAAFAAGTVTPLDVTAAYLARIDRENPALGAFVTVTRERAVDDTRRLMMRLAAGAARGPLAGVPIAHKDLFATRGIRTTGGSRLTSSGCPNATRRSSPGSPRPARCSSARPTPTSSAAASRPSTRSSAPRTTPVT